MIHRFSPATDEVVRLAFEYTEQRQARRLGTEHLLLGLVSDRHSGAAVAIGVDAPEVAGTLDDMDREALASVGLDADVLAARAAGPRGRRARFTKGAGAVLSRMVRLADSRHLRLLTPELMTRALLELRAPDPAAIVLDRLGVDRTVVVARLDSAA
jgi:hypothetical protein